MSINILHIFPLHSFIYEAIQEYELIKDKYQGSMKLSKYLLDVII